MAVRLAAAFLTGAACALWLFPLLAGPTIQKLRLERDSARGEVETLKTEVRKLKDSLQRPKTGPTVTQVVVQFEGPDRRVVVESERRLQKQLAEQYAGRNIDDVSPFLMARRIQGQLLEIDGLRYQVDVELVVVGPELAVYGVLARVPGPR